MDQKEIFKEYEITEIKSPLGEVEELRFKIFSVIGVNKKIKTIVLSSIVVFGIIFCLFHLVFLPFFIFVFLFLLNTQSVVVNKEKLVIKLISG